MKDIADSVKVFVIFGALTVYINKLKDAGLKHAAKLWFERFNKVGLQLWKEIQKNTQDQGEETTYTFDELEAYTVEVLGVAFQVDMEDFDDFITHIKAWKKPSDS